MSTDTWWTIRRALVEYRDKDFSSATNEQMHAMTDALAADLESQLAEQKPAPVSATEPEARQVVVEAKQILRAVDTAFDAMLQENTTLRARLTALETVTEAEVEAARKVVFVKVANRNFSGQPYSVDEMVRDALTAARGGSV